MNVIKKQPRYTPIKLFLNKVKLSSHGLKGLEGKDVQIEININQKNGSEPFDVNDTFKHSNIVYPPLQDFLTVGGQHCFAL